MDDQKNIDQNRFYTILLFSSVFILYLPTFYKLYMWWESDVNYNHGIIIPLAAIYLIWKKRDILKTLRAESYTPGIYLILVGIIFYFIGIRIEFLRIAIFSFFSVLFGLLLYFYGKEVTRELLFPICFLLLMIPIPYIDGLTLPLKLFASMVSAGFIKLIGIPVIRNGNLIYLKNFTFEVATSCSGLKSIVLVTTVGIFYAYIMQKSLSRRLFISISSIFIAIVANISRIVLTALVSYYFGEKLAFKFTHDFSGIFVFIIAGAMLVITGEAVNWIFREKTTGY
ncbi:MAG: exosortase/archaeosortase family protein [bacterium]|nr:exosortase/archaeosortase family protein [bacterium]